MSRAAVHGAAAEAMASYARMADDDTLYNMARRIQGRAIRRAGELLKQYDAFGGASTAVRRSRKRSVRLASFAGTRIMKWHCVTSGR